MIKNISLSVCLFVLGIHTYAQDGLLEELNNDAVDTSYELPAFKAMRIANLQSTKIAGKGDFYLYVSHRFSSVSDGFETFFGLDNANTRIQFVYSFWDGIQFSLSRESWRQTYAGAIKYRIARQSDRFGFNIVGFHTGNINAEINTNILPTLTPADRWSFAHQLLVSRRLSDAFSLQIAPTYIRENLQDIRSVADANHQQFAMGIGGRLKISKRTSINADYAYNFNRASGSVFKNPLTIGVDIETGGHVFQLLFSNAQSTNEPGFISNARGDWTEGKIFFGFNIVRVF